MREGWEVKPFENCIERVVYSTKIQRKDFLPEGTYPIVSQEDAFVNGFWDKKEDLLAVDSPVVVFGDHTRTLKYIDFDFVLGADGVKVLKPKPFLYPRFFYYQLQTAKLDSLGYARHYRLLRELSVVYPPLPEQRRIVAVLDEAFEGIAIAKANAEKNLQNSRELFESHLNAMFSQRGEGWVNIGAVGVVFDGPHATPETVDNGPIFLGIGALSNGKINLGETRHVSPEDYKKWTRRVTPRSGDIVFSYETRLGQAAIIPDDLECCLGRRMGLFRGNQQRILPSFFIYQYISPPFQEFINTQIVRGATVDRISIKDFPSFPIWLPSIEEQQRIGVTSAAMSDETQRLESLYQQKLTALDELKQSLLHQAFNGDL